MIILYFHLQPQYRYELFHRYFRSYAVLFNTVFSTSSVLQHLSAGCFHEMCSFSVEKRYLLVELSSKSFSL